MIKTAEDIQREKQEEKDLDKMLAVSSEMQESTFSSSIN
jgi:hypothetical protein